MIILFSNEEFLNGSVNGQKSNLNKSSSYSKPIKAKLDETKMKALKSTYDFFKFIKNNEHLMMLKGKYVKRC